MMGVTEIRELACFPGYFVSDSGRLFSSWQKNGNKPFRDDENMRELPLYRNAWGYLGTSIRSKNGKWKGVLVHILILETFTGPRPPKNLARHLNDNKDDNTLGNLSWGTAKQNHEDRDRNGHTARGERNGQTKLTGEMVVEIRNRLASGESEGQVAIRFGVWRSCIWKIKKRIHWKHIP